MSNLSKKITAVIMAVIVVLGMAGYFSYTNFIKPVGAGIIKGYDNNTPPEEKSLSGRIEYYKTVITDNVNKAVDSSKNYININGFFQRVLGRKNVEDAGEDLGVIKLQNNFLTFVIKQADTVGLAEKLVDFGKSVTEKGIDFLYVQAPYKNGKYDNQFPRGVEDYSNENTDNFLFALENGGISFMDLRQTMHNSGVNHYDMFFKTDHHWTPQAGLWASGKVLEHLKENYSFEYDASHYDIKNYNVKTYENLFLGSQGKRVGKYYGGTDDFYLITPAFKTDLTFSIPSHSVEKSGSFEETVIDYEQIEKATLFNNTPYAAYSYGDYALKIITNNNTQSTKRVLFIRDSFSCVFVPYFALSCKEVHIIDLRIFKESALDYVETMQPDMVIVMYNPGALVNNDEMFEFDKTPQ